MAGFVYLGKREIKLKGYSKELTLQAGERFTLEGGDVLKMKKCIDIAQAECPGDSAFITQDDFEIRQLQMGNFVEEEEKPKEVSTEPLLQYSDKDLRDMIKAKGKRSPKDATKVELVKKLKEIENG